MKSVIQYFLVLAVAFFSMNGNAVVIFDNGSSINQRGGWSDLDQGQELADDFLLGLATNTVTAISWSGSYYESNTPVAADDFTFKFFSHDLPLSPFMSISVGNRVNRQPSGLTSTSFSLDVYDYFALIPATVFAPDETFYLSIVNNTAGASDDWLWETSSSYGGNGVYRTQPGEPWNEVVSEFAFQLHGIPIPGTVYLLGVACCLLRWQTR